MRANPAPSHREYCLRRRSTASLRPRCTEDARRREQALRRRQERAAARAYGADGGADADADRREEERALLAKNERAAARARLHTIAAEYAQLLSGLLGRLQQQGHIEVCADLGLDSVSLSVCASANSRMHMGTMHANTLRRTCKTHAQPHTQALMRMHTHAGACAHRRTCALRRTPMHAPQVRFLIFRLDFNEFYSRHAYQDGRSSAWE